MQADANRARSRERAIGSRACQRRRSRALTLVFTAMATESKAVIVECASVKLKLTCTPKILEQSFRKGI